MAGHVAKRPGNSKRPWQCTYYDDRGKRRAKSFARKLDAERFLATVTVKVLAGDYVDPDAGKLLLGTYARQWLDSHDVRDSTRSVYEGYLGHMLDGPVPLRGVPLGDLRASLLRDWQRSLSGRLAPSTVATIRGVFSSILKAAVVDKVIARNPFADVPTPPKAPRALLHPMPVEHVLAVRDNIAPSLAASIVVGAGLGTRRGECMGLTVDRVDFLRRLVTIDRQLVDVTSDGRPRFGPPKTAASVRQVPAPQSVLDALAAHLAQFPPGGDGLIFTAPRGGPVTRHKLGDAWRRAEIRIWAKAHGYQLGTDGLWIPPAALTAWRTACPDGHGHRFHELRHFYASVLIADGRSVKTVQARLGHATAAETLDTYSHLWPDDEDRTRGAIDAVFRLDDDQGEAGGAVPVRV